MGCGFWGVFFSVLLLMVWFVIVGGVFFVVMEIIVDFGIVSYFGIQIFVIGIYISWFGFVDWGVVM